MEMQKKYETVPFNVHHLEVMDIRNLEEIGIMTLPNSKTRFEAMTETSIDCKSFLYDGRVIFCAGYYELWPGVIECWMVPSKNVEKAKLGFCRILRNYVNGIIEERKCHRFQTTTPDDELHHRWMRFLGMEKEGVLKKYTHKGKDYCMYARTV